jgi:hypothetical protein
MNNKSIRKGWWVTEHAGADLWHLKKGPRSMTKLYRTQAEMVADNGDWDFYYNCRIKDLSGPGSKMIKAKREALMGFLGGGKRK